MTNVREAVAWLAYTYLFVRMKKNPLAYGIPWDELAIEPELLDRRRQLITNAARELERSKMARFDERSGNLYVTDLGRVASHFYIRHSSIIVYSEHLKSHMTEPEVSVPHHRLRMTKPSSLFCHVACSLHSPISLKDRSCCEGSPYSLCLLSSRDAPGRSQQLTDSLL